jgi:hypothetical protein
MILIFIYFWCFTVLNIYIFQEHMAIHTGEVLYTCPYCPKTGNNSSNMYNHKKTHIEHKMN